MTAEGEMAGLPRPLEEDPEGAYDLQLSLPLSQVAEALPFTTIIKRDGREEIFDKHKIASAIFSASASMGGEDRDVAESLAAAVRIYLVKILKDQPPTVDQVHDAVERVLIHMAHARTALAYARYRDRRARVRRLREGDMRALLGELEEAQQERDRLGGDRRNLLSVRTGTECLVDWDREKIVAALIRETGLERAMATVIAHEVEQQIGKAQIASLTTSLIRELVDAKLVEHGLEAYRERHCRLGLPRYDTERTILGVTAETLGGDPVSTDQVLARAVKKEYALTEVFSPTVAEAHLRGDLHLHHLGLVDRLHAIHPSLADVARHGIGAPGAPTFAGPPKYPDTLLAQMVKTTDLYQSFFAGDVVWESVNVFAAPFLHGRDDRELEQFAQMLIYEYAYRATTRQATLPAVSIGLDWVVPPSLAEAEAIGPGGEAMGKCYQDYQHTAQRFVSALMETLQRGGAEGVSFAAPVAILTLSPAAFRDPGFDSFLELAAGIAGRRRKLRFLMDRHDRVRGGGAAWRPRMAALHEVTINLPRAAYESGKEAALCDRLAGIMQVAADAHREKRDFVERLLDPEGNGPLAAFAAVRDGGPLIEPDDLVCLVGVEGLNEAVQVLYNAPLHNSGEAIALGERILQHMRDWCLRESARSGLRLKLAQNRSRLIGERFATLDANAYPKTASSVLRVDPKTQALHYTTGVQLCEGHGCGPIEQVRLEGRLHAALSQGADTCIALPLEEAPGDSLAAFLKKTFRQTENKCLSFV